jgi:hypothetical protein
MKKKFLQFLDAVNIVADGISQCHELADRGVSILTSDQVSGFSWISALTDAIRSGFPFSSESVEQVKVERETKHAADVCAERDVEDAGSRDQRQLDDGLEKLEALSVEYLWPVCESLLGNFKPDGTRFVTRCSC